MSTEKHSEKHTRIKYIVYLMLENRSLDNVLGWLYENDSPAHVHPPDSCPHFDGLHKDFFNLDANGMKHHVIRGTKGRHSVPRFDPNETFEHVNDQLFESSATPNRRTDLASEPATPTMGGFYRDYARWYRNNDEIMMTYTPEDLPVLNTLARHFAVSDRYFSSVPTQTNCNRAFAAAGNSLGKTKNGDLCAWVNNRNSNLFARPGGKQFSERTIWNVLDEQDQNLPSDWMIFNSKGNWLESIFQVEGYRYTRRIMDQLQDSCFDKHFADVGSASEAADNTLFGMIASGTLPRFSFVEPSWTLPLGPGFGPNGTDYHPPGDILKGEQFVTELYNALSGNPDIWNSLLFIINFDEHGGTYDHVPPPSNAEPPWHDTPDTPTPIACENGFQFDRFGVRVPLILVSPFVREKTVFRASGETPYDHTSVLATILHLMGVERRHWRLGARVEGAPLFNDVLDEHARDDVPSLTDLCKERPVVEPDMSKRLYDALLTDYPDHRAGMRPVHAVGIGATGYFVASDAAKRYTFAEQFQGAHIPVTLRYSNGSGSPVEHDSALDVRGMAVKFHLQDGSESDLIAITLPIFFARNPEAFLQFAAAGVPVPDKAESWFQRLLDILQLRNPARPPDLPEDGTVGVTQYANTHMAARPGTVAATMLVTPVSYGRAAYHALHTFKLIAADGAVTYCRFDWDPVVGVQPIEKGVPDPYRPGEPRNRKDGDNQFLHQELRNRLKAGPVRFVLRMNVAGQGDDINDPTKVWDTTRLRVVLGELWITEIAADNGTACEHLSFNPTRLAPGIECSDDPVLAARRGAYEYSCRTRGGSGCPVGGGRK
jgi:phospholipase C